MDRRKRPATGFEIPVDGGTVEGQVVEIETRQKSGARHLRVGVVDRTIPTMGGDARGVKVALLDGDTGRVRRVFGHVGMGAEQRWGEIDSMISHREWVPLRAMCQYVTTSPVGILLGVKRYDFQTELGVSYAVMMWDSPLLRLYESVGKATCHLEQCEACGMEGLVERGKRGLRSLVGRVRNHSPSDELLDALSRADRDGWLGSNPWPGT